MKDIKEEASAKTAGREFHKGTVCGKKLNLKESLDGEKCLYLFELVDLVLVFRNWSAGMSIKLFIMLKSQLNFGSS